MLDSPIPLSHIGAFIPFPTILLDEQMPILKDTEWRLLCVIVRQTLGWRSGQGRKKRDWMSQKQLMARTGRNSAALSAALDSLVCKGLVECCDKDGQALLTRSERRRHRGRVYFALRASVLSKGTLKEPSSQAHTSVYSNAYSLRSCHAGKAFSGWENAHVVAERRDNVYKTEVQKAKRTKERRTKEN